MRKKRTKKPAILYGDAAKKMYKVEVNKMPKKQAVYGIVFNDSRSQVLLVKRRDIPVWVLPGGGLEQNETPEDGACREVLEESGYEVSAIRKVAEYLPVTRMTKISHVFECCVIGGSAKTGKESIAVAFFSLQKLPPLPPPYEGWIKDAAANFPYIIRKKIEGVSYFILCKLMIRHPLLVGRYLLTKLGLHFNN